MLVALGTLSRNSQVVSLDFLLDSECHVTRYTRTPLKSRRRCLRMYEEEHEMQHGVAASPCRGRGVTALSVVELVYSDD